MKNSKITICIILAAVILVVAIMGITFMGDSRKGEKEKATDVAKNDVITEKATDSKDEDDRETISVVDNPLTFKSFELSKCSYPETTSYLDEEISYDAFYATSIREFLKNAGNENLVYSPLNVQMALSMLAEVTDGNSRRQILDALGVADMGTLREQTNAIWKANYSDDDVVTNILANSIWLSDSISYNKDTINTLADYYYVSAFGGVMGSDEYNKALQDWLNEQTGNMLNEQISDIKMDRRTVMMLASTVYFRAKWNNTFSDMNTTENIFYGANKNVSCDFMNSGRCEEYYWGENFSAVSEKFNKGGEMWFILPDEGSSVEELLMDSEAMSFILSNGDWDKHKYLIVNKSIPKFDLSSQISLEDGLKSLGVTDVFDVDTADFTALTTDVDDIWLSKAQHGARVAIDEEGCIATAYTVMMATGSSIPLDEEVDFVADRPFLFVINSDEGLPLFVGVVNNMETSR